MSRQIDDMGDNNDDDRPVLEGIAGLDGALRDHAHTVHVMMMMMMMMMHR